MNYKGVTLSQYYERPAQLCFTNKPITRALMQANVILHHNLSHYKGPCGPLQALMVDHYHSQSQTKSLLGG